MHGGFGGGVAHAVRHRFDQSLDFGRPAASVFGIAALHCFKAAAHRGLSADVDTPMIMPVDGRAANICNGRDCQDLRFHREGSREVFASIWHEQRTRTYPSTCSDIRTVHLHHFRLPRHKRHIRSHVNLGRSTNCCVR